MDLYLQFGWGMKKLALDFSKTWDNVKVILSPRDISTIQLNNWSKEFRAAKISCLFDPQCYFPKCNHPRLSQYGYMNKIISTNLSDNVNSEYDLIKEINEYNEIVNTDKFIIPCAMKMYDNYWLNIWKEESGKLIKASKSIVMNKKILLTIAIPSGVLNQSEEIIEKIIETCDTFDVDGYYIIAEPVAGKYLCDEPLWLSNLLQLCAGLKLQKKEVIVGYASQQFLCLSTAKVDAIASGTYLNVRKFSNKFEVNFDIKRKSVWYYYPESLSEYKIQFLDVAFNNGVLDEMKPGSNYNNKYIDLIFSGIIPQSTTFNETLAFKHYLDCLRKQTHICSRNSFKETISANEVLLETARRRIEFLEKNGVYAQVRSFKDIIDVNRSAMQRLQKNRGFLLEHSWDDI